MLCLSRIYASFVVDGCLVGVGMVLLVSNGRMVEDKRPRIRWLMPIFDCWCWNVISSGVMFSIGSGNVP